MTQKQYTRLLLLVTFLQLYACFILLYFLSFTSLAVAIFIMLIVNYLNSQMRKNLIANASKAREGDNKIYKILATFATTDLVLKEAGIAYAAKDFERYTQLMDYVNKKFKHL